MILFTLLSLNDSRAAIHDNGLLGNGGKAVVYQGQLIVQDLYLEKVTTPYFGKSIDPDTVNRILTSKVTAKLNLDHLLLARKLTDMNQVWPRLGLYVLLSMESHKLLVIDEPKTLPALSEGSEALVALRTKQQIIVYGNWYKQLSPQQKIALFIHEGIYSLARVKCLQKYHCSQNLGKVQTLVASLFKYDSLLNAKALQDMIEETLFLARGQCTPEILDAQVFNTETLSARRYFFDRKERRYDSIAKALCAEKANSPTAPLHIFWNERVVEDQVYKILYPQIARPFSPKIHLTSNIVLPKTYSYSHQSVSTNIEDCVFDIYRDLDVLNRKRREVKMEALKPISLDISLYLESSPPPSFCTN